MSFIDTPRFPTRVGYGAIGGPRFSTDVVELDGGDEVRNQNWSQARADYSIDLMSKTSADRDEVIGYFRAVAKGMANGFRFKDYNDFQVSLTQGVLSLISAGLYQLVKRYTQGSQTYDRNIYKPEYLQAITLKQGSTVLVAGVDYTLDTTLGRVTVLSSPTPVPTVWSGNFDVPVRFDSDYLGMRALTLDNAGAIIADAPGIKLVEIREIS